jgi:hypothetical protein
LALEKVGQSHLALQETKLVAAANNRVMAKMLLRFFIIYIA